MQIISQPPLSESYKISDFIRDVLGAGQLTSSLQVVRIAGWVEVTHDTKNTVMSAISADDLKAVNSKNPDIYVHGKGSKNVYGPEIDPTSIYPDTIVLVPPKTKRNEDFRYRIRATSVRASELFGNDWKMHLNAKSFLKLNILLSSEQYQDIPSLENSVALMAHIGRDTWMGTISLNPPLFQNT
jgi:hypothetical protein